MELLKQLLAEGRKEYVISTLGDKIYVAFRRDRGQVLQNVEPDALVRHVVNTFANICGEKYIVWLIRQYIDGKFRLEDIIQIRDDLELFDRVKERLEVKDIGRYTLNELRVAIRPFRNANVMTGGEQERLAKQGAEKIYDSDAALILKVKTKEAACYYGAGTRWCTAADNNNMFAQYNKQGPLYILIDKKNNRKYQFHVESGQLMDEEDDMVYPSFIRHVFPMFTAVMKKEREFDEAERLVWFGEMDRVLGVIVLTSHNVWLALPNKLRDWDEMGTYMYSDMEWNKGVSIKRVLDDVYEGLGVDSYDEAEVNSATHRYQEFKEYTERFTPFADKELWWGTNYHDQDTAVLIVWKK